MAKSLAGITTVWHRLVLAIGLLLGLLVAPAAWAQDITPSERVVRNVVVRAAPSTASAAISRLLPGEALAFVADAPSWYQVRLADGRIGFVSKAWTVLVPTEPTGPLALSSDSYTVHVIDVGTGLAVFVDGPDFTLLYDGGSQDDLAMGENNRVVAYIDAVHPGLRTIDHLILSHPHKDHLELLPDVFDRFSVRNVWESGRVNRTVGYCRFLKKVSEEPGVVYHDAIASGEARTVVFTASTCNGTVTVRQGPQMTATPVPLGTDASMTLLYRDARAYPDPNGNSVVTLLSLGGRRVLLTGDAEGGDRAPPSGAPRPNSIEGRLLACCRADLRADAVVVGHHGSLTSSRSAFIDATGARIFAISSGPHAYSRVVLPDPEIVAVLTTGGRQVLRTDLNDEACLLAPAKIGPDEDESPGGCSNIVLTIAEGMITGGYGDRVD